MGIFMEEITLLNIMDRGLAERNYIEEAQIRVSLKQKPRFSPNRG